METRASHVGSAIHAETRGMERNQMNRCPSDEEHSSTIQDVQISISISKSRSVKNQTSSSDPIQTRHQLDQRCLYPKLLCTPMIINQLKPNQPIHQTIPMPAHHHLAFHLAWGFSSTRGTTATEEGLGEGDGASGDQIPQNVITPGFLERGRG